MENWHLEKYEEEVRRQARYARMAWADLQTALASNDDERAWYSVQALLVAAANISKLFWPPKPGDKTKQPDRSQRGAALRDRFALSGSHNLENRKMRDHFEHFDERLDDWRNLDPPYWIDSTIYQKNEPYAVITHVQGQEVKEARALDAHCKLHFCGESYDLRTVIEAIDSLQSV